MRSPVILCLEVEDGHLSVPPNACPDCSSDWELARKFVWPITNKMRRRDLCHVMDMIAGRCAVADGTVVLLPDGDRLGKFAGAVFIPG